jgi:hypothetical protein
VVGLARCALARGEDRKAYALAARALAIDPENDMARRMEARMAEVLTYRGEALPDPATGSPGTVAASAPPAASPASSTSSPTSRSWLDRLRGH